MSLSLIRIFFFIINTAKNEIKTFNKTNLFYQTAVYLILVFVFIFNENDLKFLVKVIEYLIFFW